MKSDCGGRMVLHVAGRNIKRIGSMGLEVRLFKSPFTPWQRQMRALLTSDLKPSQHVLGGARTLVLVRYPRHGNSPISGVRHSLGCGGEGGTLGVPGVLGSGSNGGSGGKLGSGGKPGSGGNGGKLGRPGSGGKPRKAGKGKAGGAVVASLIAAS